DPARVCVLLLAARRRSGGRDEDAPRRDRESGEGPSDRRKARRLRDRSGLRAAREGRRRDPRGAPHCGGARKEGRAGEVAPMSRDRVSGLAWLTVALFAAVQGLSLGLGSLHRPDPGFFPFWGGVALGPLSTLLCVRPPAPAPSE